MNATTTAPLPASLQRAETQAAESGDLDERIRLAEQRLIARDETLRRRFGLLGTRAKDLLQPRRLLAPLAGGAVALGALWWMWRGLGPRMAPAPVASPPRPVKPQLPWVSLLGLAWPLLPRHWRSRVSPATASTAIAFGLPLVERLLARRHAPPLAAMPAVDLARCEGRWQVAAAFDDMPPAIALALRDDGHIVLDLGDHDALLRAVPGGGGARLEATAWPEALRFLPLAWQPLAILHVDPDYREALVGNPARDALWLLSRDALAPERVRALQQIALERGFDIERLRWPPP